MNREQVKALLALLLLVPAASFGTWVGMVYAPGDVGSAVFLAAKLWLVALPITWHVLVDRRPLRFPWPSGEGIAAACVTGALIFAAIAAAYWFIGRDWIDPARLRSKAIELNIGTPATYLLGALYWCTINSLVEEYVWRWFVFTRLEVLVPRLSAVLLCALFFTLHHIIALQVYFDWRVVTLASLGVFIGGATWSVLYLRYRNIWAAYVSHVFADVVIFIIGWIIIFER